MLQAQLILVRWKTTTGTAKLLVLRKQVRRLVRWLLREALKGCIVSRCSSRRILPKEERIRCCYLGYIKGKPQVSHALAVIEKHGVNGDQDSRKVQIRLIRRLCKSLRISKRNRLGVMWAYGSHPYYTVGEQASTGHRLSTLVFAVHGIRADCIFGSLNDLGIVSERERRETRTMSCPVWLLGEYSYLFTAVQQVSMLKYET